MLRKYLCTMYTKKMPRVKVARYMMAFLISSKKWTKSVSVTFFVRMIKVQEKWYHSFWWRWEGIENTLREFSTFKSMCTLICIERMTLTSLETMSTRCTRCSSRSQLLVARADMANTYLHYSRKKHQTCNNRPKEEFNSKYVVQLLFKLQASNAWYCLRDKLKYVQGKLQFCQRLSSINISW